MPRLPWIPDVNVVTDLVVDTQRASLHFVPANHHIVSCQSSFMCLCNCPHDKSSCLSLRMPYDLRKGANHYYPNLRVKSTRYPAKSGGLCTPSRTKQDRCGFATASASAHEINMWVTCCNHLAQKPDNFFSLEVVRVRDDASKAHKLTVKHIQFAGPCKQLSYFELGSSCNLVYPLAWPCFVNSY